MNNARSQQGKTIPKPNSGGVRSLPYGMADDPHAGARKSPCVDYYQDLPGVMCPVFMERMKHKHRVRLPRECKHCEYRVSYADSMDPSRSRANPTENRRMLMEELASSRIGRSQEACLLRARYWAKKLGWPSYREALRSLYFDEELTTHRIGVLLHISHSKVQMDLKKAGYTLRGRSENLKQYKSKQP